MGIPMLNSKQAWPRTIHSGSMSKVNYVKTYKCNISRYSWYFNLGQLRQCIDEWYNYISQGLQYKPTIVRFYIMWIKESMSSIIKHHLIIGHWCIPLRPGYAALIKCAHIHFWRIYFWHGSTMYCSWPCFFTTEHGYTHLRKILYMWEISLFYL